MSTSKKPGADRDRTDWERLARLTDDDIGRMAEEDKDNPVTFEADWADATIDLPPRKTRIHASLDGDVVAWFRAQGPGYQTQMNAVLRRYMEAQIKKAG